MSTNEDRFFGVTHQVVPRAGEVAAEKAPDGTPDLTIQVIQDGEQPRTETPPTEEKPQQQSHQDDDELESYSESVKKRINRLTFEKHEERRHREQAERMREEAIRATEALLQKNREYEAIIAQGETALISQMKERAAAQVARAKDAYRVAYEAGQTDKVIEAQEALSRAVAELQDAERRERFIQSRQQQATAQPQQQAPQATPAQQPTQQQAPQVRLTQEQQQWAERNPWFGHPDHPDMTALAYGIHERLIRRDGIAPNTPEYFRGLDAAMRERFPEYFAGEKGDAGHSAAASQQSKPNTVVAPAARNNGAAPRQVQLTASQVALAKRLGLTPEQYARQLIKETSNG